MFSDEQQWEGESAIKFFFFEISLKTKPLADRFKCSMV